MKQYSKEIENMIESVLELFGHLPQSEREEAITQSATFEDGLCSLNEEVFTSISEFPEYLTTDPAYGDLAAVTEWAVECMKFKGSEILQSIRPKYTHFAWTFTKEAKDFLKNELGEFYVDTTRDEKQMLAAFAICVDHGEIYDVFDGVDWEYSCELHDAYIEHLEMEAIQEAADNEMFDHRREILDSIHLRAEQLNERLAA